MADMDDREERDEVEEIEPSALDEATHRELGYLYDDSTRTILFAKGMQWKTVGATLIIFLLLIVLTKFISRADDFVRILKIVIIVSSMGAIFMLLLFQLWQHSEAKKIIAVEKNFSSLFRSIRKKKSKLEANIHRYILLTFMVVVICAGAFVTILSIDKLS